MTSFAQPWLAEDEVLFHRMEAFHRQRVEAIASGQSLLDKRDGGILVVHLIPRSCVQGRLRFDGAKLKEHGGLVPPLGGRGDYARFNVDGLLRYNGHEVVRDYSQLFRDGRLEAVMPEVAFPLDRKQKDSVHCLRDSICEEAVFNTVAGYLRFCKAIGLDVPIQMFSALIGCEGVRICTDMSFRDISDHAIDRSPVFLPDIEISSLDAGPKDLLRPWCDTLWQACGMERSFSFDQQGQWRERRR
jgi:hypothetical protein